MNTLKLITTGLMMSITMIALSNLNNSIDSLSLEIVEIQKPTCYNSANGMISIVPKGGQAPYTYNWNTFPNQTTPTATNLSGGIYFVEITDANGVSYFEAIELIAPSPVNVAKKSVVSNENDESIVNLEFNIEGGSAPYIYEFNGSLLSEPVISDLEIGIHKIKITDDNDCSVVQYVLVYGTEGELVTAQQEESDNPLEDTEPLLPSIRVEISSSLIPAEEENLVIANE